MSCSVVPPRCVRAPVRVAEVSLCIPVYNSAAFLDELFTCLRALDPPPAEIIFLDDASTDDSLNRLKHFSATQTINATVRVLRNEKNSGIAGAYNRLANEARGEWIQLLDADDLLVESNFYRQIEPALATANDLVVTGLTSNACLLRYGACAISWLVPRCTPIWWPLLGSFATRAGVLYRRIRLLAHPFPDPAYPGSDVIHLLDLRNRGRCVYLRCPRVFYRVHSSAQSSGARDYTAYRNGLARFHRSIRYTHALDLGLRQIGQKWTR